MPPIVTTAEIERPAGDTQVPAVGARCVTTRRIGGASRPATSELLQLPRHRQRSGAEVQAAPR